MHFILLNNLKTEIIGVCNYTDIKDNECQLGYMYQALINTNHYMFNKFDNNNAGIMKKNRSIELISRLFFKSTATNNELEINGNIEKLVIYNLVN